MEMRLWEGTYRRKGTREEAIMITQARDEDGLARGGLGGAGQSGQNWDALWRHSRQDLLADGV